MKNIIKRISELIDLKSLITITLTIALVWGFVVSKIEAKDFLIYVAMVFSFYFSKPKEEKKEEEKEVG